jgi:hypothetical protein
MRAPGGVVSVHTSTRNVGSTSGLASGADRARVAVGDRAGTGFLATAPSRGPRHRGQSQSTAENGPKPSCTSHGGSNHRCGLCRSINRGAALFQLLARCPWAYSKTPAPHHWEVGVSFVAQERERRRSRTGHRVYFTMKMLGTGGGSMFGLMRNPGCGGWL